MELVFLFVLLLRHLKEACTQNVTIVWQRPNSKVYHKRRATQVAGSRSFPSVDFSSLLIPDPLLSPNIWIEIMQPKQWWGYYYYFFKPAANNPTCWAGACVFWVAEGTLVNEPLVSGVRMEGWRKFRLYLSCLSDSREGKIPFHSAATFTCFWCRPSRNGAFTHSMIHFLHRKVTALFFLFCSLCAWTKVVLIVYLSCFFSCCFFFVTELSERCKM